MKRGTNGVALDNSACKNDSSRVKLAWSAWEKFSELVVSPLNDTSQIRGKPVLFARPPREQPDTWRYLFISCLTTKKDPSDMNLKFREFYEIRRIALTTIAMTATMNRHRSAVLNLPVLGLMN